MRGCVIFITLVVCSGCGAEDRIEVYPVEGQVLVGGQPAAGALVIFHPSDSQPEGFPAARPRGSVDAEGHFSLTTFETGDGAPVGNYTVTVVWQTRVEETEELTPDRLAGRYDNPQASQLKVTLRPEPNQLEPFELSLRNE